MKDQRRDPDAQDEFAGCRGLCEPELLPWAVSACVCGPGSLVERLHLAAHCEYEQGDIERGGQKNE